MTTATLPQAVTDPPAVLDRVRDLYLRGLALQAYHAAEPLGPFRHWTQTAARLLAGRVAAHLGAARLTWWLHLWAHRQAPDDPEAACYFGRGLLERRGPLAAWRFLRNQGELEGATDALRADWLALHGCVLGRLRDFDAAEAWLDRAQALAPDEPWPWIERAGLLDLEDRYEESLAASRRALQLRPWYRPGVQAVAHTLVLLGRDGEALELLTESAQRLESTFILSHLGALQTELAHHADARRTYDRFAELAVLLEKAGAAWLAARRADTAYFCGDRAAAVELARQVGEPLYQDFAAELGREPFDGRRVLLDVGFVRQHHATCVPATLAALARYWGRPVDHRDVAGAICYDGTPDHRERAWAEENGYVCREFTVTWESAVALIDRGVPFTLTLVEPSYSHMQAVIGYDTCRKSLLARDPSFRQHVEYHAEGLLRRCRSTGPRGHALVPQDQAHRLDGLTLPDAGLYDRLHRLQRALQRHDRAAAQEECTALRAEAPEHRQTWHARRVLAVYDADPAEMLACAEGLLRLFPGDPLWLLLKLYGLRDQARREELIAELDSACARPGADPVFRRLRAREALADAREHPRAIRLLRKAIRCRPYDKGNLSTLAQLLWGQRRFEEALELYGFAACLDDKDEGLARDYFLASQHLRRAGQTLGFLRRRFERFGAKSSQPALTLYWALEAGNRVHEGLAVLDEALRLRPDDPELLLFAARCRAENGDFERAQDLLARANGRCPAGGWLRACAALAEVRGDSPAALALWQRVVEAEPAALDAARAVAGHLAGLEDRGAALAFLRGACERFPHNYPLHQLLSGWLREQGPAAQEPVVRHIIAIHPADAWARRELALVLTEQGRLDEALAELEEARGLEPESPSYWCVLGGLRERQGRLREARDAYRGAIRLSVDYDWAIGRLMQTAGGLAERRAALAFIEGELRRQVIFGDGLLSFQRYARWTLTADELLAVLRDGHAARPELWQAWSALIVQLREMGRADEAHELAVQATERFPLLPSLWLDLAGVCQARGDAEGELAALVKATEIRPGWAVPLRLLGECHLRAGRLAEARPLLERAVSLAPLDAVSHGYLADALWKADEKEAALERVQTAVRLDPGYLWAWDRVGEWSAVLERPEVPPTLARELAASRSGEARSWLRLAQTLERREDTEERLAALERAVALNPQLSDAWDLKAVLLSGAGRWAEAEAACEPPAWNGPVPLILRGRRAWVKAQRGDVAAALAEMRAALAEDPDYHWGWTQLADWLRQHGTPEEYRQAGDNLVRIAPERPVSLGYRGEGRARCGDRAGAKDDFRRAFELAPGYSFAGMYLFDLQLADAELDAAAATLAALKPADDVYVRAREAKLAARRGDRAAALKALREVATMASDDDWPVDAAVRAVSEAGWPGWQADAAEALGEALAEPRALPVAARHWVRLSIEAGDWRCAQRLDELLTRGAVGTAALEAYVHALGGHRHRVRLAECVARYRETLRAHVQTWGVVGYAYARLEDYQAVCEWLQDWAARDGVRPWMLMNLVLALRYFRRDKEANAVSRHARTLGGDNNSDYHRVWLAFDEALAGRAAEGLRALDGVATDGLDPTHRFVRGLVAALAEVRGAGFAAARRRLVEAAKASSPLPEDGPVVRAAYRAAVRRLGSDRGGLVGRLWALWRWWRPVLPDRVAG